MGWKKAQITVLKCMDNRRIQEEHRIGGYSGPCDAFEVGQQFVAGWDVPEGFCAFAYAAIHRDILMIQAGGSLEAVEPEHTAIGCCQDALCPVVFKIERLEENLREGDGHGKTEDHGS
ncbi:TIGR04076 family protein [Candidatus Bipolaricaulota bacterium]|nr:TIGR04076 family protein [Candidatus Bipolaricaulota bacterium]